MVSNIKVEAIIGLMLEEKSKPKRAASSFLALHIYMINKEALAAIFSREKTNDLNLRQIESLKSNLELGQVEELRFRTPSLSSPE